MIMKTKLFLIGMFFLSLTTLKAQNVISGTDCTSAVLKDMMTKGGFTLDALLAALDMFKTTYLYAIVTVDSKELFK